VRFLNGLKCAANSTEAYNGFIHKIVQLLQTVRTSKSYRIRISKSNRRQMQFLIAANSIPQLTILSIYFTSRSFANGLPKNSKSSDKIEIHEHASTFEIFKRKNSGIEWKQAIRVVGEKVEEGD
jgi:hypothetical protein